MKYQIVYTRDASLTSRLIRKFTWGDHSHVALVHKGVAYEARISQGVTKRPVEELFEQYETYAIYEMDASIRVLDFIKRQVGRPYDYAGIAGVVLREDTQNALRWFCSELIAAAFASDGRPLLRTRRFGRLTPAILELSPLPQLIART